jgi:hypothetical protein
MSDITHDHLFMAVIFIIGLIVTSASWDIDAKLQDTKCNSSSLKTANKLALVIGVIFITSSLSFFGCSSRCQSVMSGLNITIYISTLLLLGIILIVLGSIISAASIDTCTNDGNPISIWGLGVIIVLACLYYFFLTYRHMINI